MKPVKKTLSLLMVVIMILSTAVPAFAAPATTVNEKAEALNYLSLLQGSASGDYMLDKPLLRSQAATFIVRLLGRVNHVEENKFDYAITRVPDVPIDSWYAPYVGYCTTQGIIAGNGEGYFEPDENISEKAFLKLLLTALGYEYGVDFNWSNVFQKAYEAGLVTDISYLTKTADNNNYLRADVVNAMYNALTRVNIKTNMTLLQNLIDEDVITENQAAYAGFGTGKGPEIGVTQINSVSPTNVYILFDKKVQTVSESAITIYETGNSANTLDFKIIAQQSESLVLQTSDQIPYMGYTVEIRNITAEGEMFPSTVTATFEGYRASELQSDFFKISKVVPVNRSTVNVYFTHPINSNSAKASYYEIWQGETILAQGSLNMLTASFGGTPDNMVSVNLIGVTFTENTQYTLKVSGELTSLYTVKLNDGEGDTYRFSVSSLPDDTTPNTSTFSMNKITLLDYKTMQLEFNMEVHPLRAQQVFSYYITDSYGNPVAVTKAAIGGSGTQSGKIVHLSINGSFIKNTTYKLKINEINDITRQYTIFDKDYTFAGNYPERTILNIKSATALDKNTVAVLFDRAIDPGTASVKEYFNIVGVSATGYSTIPAKAVVDSTNANRVILYLPADKPLTSGKTYKLTVLSVMKDNLGNIAGVNREATFTGSSSEGAKPYLTDAVIIAKDTVKVTTSRDIAFSLNNISEANYTLEYEGGSHAAIIVKYIDSRTLVIKFDTLDFEKEYTLRFNSLTDASELYTRTQADGQNTIKVRMGK
jgi:hypothetical protein